MVTARRGTDALSDGWQERQHLRLGAALDAVQRARHLLGACPDIDPVIAHDAEIVVSELVTNAVLHGRPPIDLYVRTSGGRARVEVHDAGRTPPILGQPNAEAMTGRGLAMVAALSVAWGVEALGAGGKAVWAELEADRAREQGLGTGGGAAGVDNVEALLAAWADELPEKAVHTIVLGPVATALVVAAKAHVDNVARELALMRELAGAANTWAPTDLAEIVDVITNRFADARTELKLEAAAAAAKGQPVTDLVFHLPASAAYAGEKYLEVLDRVDRYARSAQMLTLASPPEHRLFRRWYVTNLVTQLRALERGESPPSPQPFQMVLAREIARLSPLEHVSARLELLQKVAREMAGTNDPVLMAQIVVAGAMEVPEVETARVRLLDGAKLLQSVAWQGRGSNASEALPAYSLYSDTFGAEAVRTGRPVLIRSLAEAFALRPDILAFYDKDMSVHVVPLVSGERRFGMLSLTFDIGALSEDVELAVVSSLASVLSQGLVRAELANRERKRQETLDFLAMASQILASVEEPSEVLERFVELAVPRLGDWCTVYVPDGNGHRLRRTAVAVNGHPELAERFRGTFLDMDLEPAAAHTRAYLTGEVQLLPEGTGHVAQRLYPDEDFHAISASLARSAGISMPITLRGSVVGVIGLTFAPEGPGARLDVQEALAGLAERAAVAMDNARRWAAREELVQALVAALMPAPPPEVRGVRFAVRYRPAVGSVAGDWWEVDQLSDGSVLIGLGDAAGHGMPAVPQMLELRHGARALAAVERSPAALLWDLNRRLESSTTGIATAVYGRLSPETGTLVLASAGHPPPLLLLADGTAELLNAPKGTALGSPVPAQMADARFQLHPGETLVIYSDGVVETYQRGLDEGIAQLVRTAQASAGKDLEELADALAQEHCKQPMDDCCLLLVRFEGTGSDLETVRSA